MNENLTELINNARGTVMTAEQRENQRQSFAYGNTKLGNDTITRDMVRRASAADSIICSSSSLILAPLE